MSTSLKAFLILAGLVSFLGGYFQALTVLFAGLTTLGGTLAIYWWNKTSFYNLKLERKLSRSRVNYGENLEYVVTLENEKLLPVLWLEMKDELTEGLAFVKTDALREPFGTEKNVFSEVFSLRWFQRVRRKYQVVANKRGLIRAGPARLNARGLFGIFQKEQKSSSKSELVVFPRVLPLARENLKERFLFGSNPQQGWIHKDPLNPVGVKPYRRSDEARRINWKATARHRNLQSDVYLPSFDPELYLFLAAPRGKAWWTEKLRNLFELSVICAASLAEAAFQARVGVGLYTNARQRGKKARTKINPDRNFRQRTRVMTVLALLEPIGQQDMGKLMRSVRQDVKPGSTVVFIALDWDDKTGVELARYAQRCQLTVVSVGDRSADKAPPNSDYRHLKGEKSWHEIESIHLGH